MPNTAAMNNHHLYWPRRNYLGNLENRFRSLPCYIIRMDELAHRLLHLHSIPPHKPRPDQMIDAIGRHERGECSCK